MDLTMEKANMNKANTNKANINKAGNASKRLLMDEELRQVGGGIPTPERMFHIRNVYEFLSRGRGHHEP